MSPDPLVLGIPNGDDIGLEIVPAAIEVARAASERSGF